MGKTISNPINFIDSEDPAAQAAFRILRSAMLIDPCHMYLLPVLKNYADRDNAFVVIIDHFRRMQPTNETANQMLNFILFGSFDELGYTTDFQLTPHDREELYTDILEFAKKTINGMVANLAAVKDAEIKLPDEYTPEWKAE